MSCSPSPHASDDLCTKTNFTDATPQHRPEELTAAAALPGNRHTVHG
ncbi:hypothetical protein SLEP1_g60114 [Rubroshorea leprosula]|uniref:Uncharacterized protein n=1 Tax=Rubroshorea leprosula TaxID=152421 RepID=A0AAV5MUC8_9ROSI|nr:hypothetical protein SLEP1_g60114 [Rubroshorea leprosula]